MKLMKYFIFVFPLWLILCNPDSAQLQNASLIGLKWQLRSIEYEQQATTPVDNANYDLSFMGDSTFVLKVRCNEGGGTYFVQGDSITISVLGITKVFCGTDSLDSLYLNALETASAFIIRGQELDIYFNGGNRLQFIAVP